MNTCKQDKTIGIWKKVASSAEVFLEFYIVSFKPFQWVIEQWLKPENGEEIVSSIYGWENGSLLVLGPGYTVETLRN